MKSGIVLSLAMAAALPALANTATTANVIGVLPIRSSSAETIIGIPWVAASLADGDIKVVDIIKTANLSEGDQLWWYDSQKQGFKCWQLNSSKEWQPAMMVSENKRPAAAEGASDKTLKRGEALVLVRTAEDLTAPFYVMGQYSSSSAAKLQLAAGSKATPAYSLIAPPSATAKELNEATWESVGANDVILIQGKIYNYNNGQWGCWEVKNGAESFVPGGTIPAGTGVWFVSKSGAQEGASVQW